jgi:soluble lytic murein transglycosylase-like protein
MLTFRQRRAAAPLDPSSFPALPFPADRRAPDRRSPLPHPVFCAGIAAILLIAAEPACAESLAVTARSINAPADSIADFIAEASQRFGIPASWIRAVMQVESAGDVRALSPAGAMGLMQIMPETWATLQPRYGLGADPYDARDNILAGAAYLRELHDRYGSSGFLAAYNAGPARYEDHLATGRPLPAETQAYLAVVAPLLGDGWAVQSVLRDWPEAPLFAAHTESAATKSPASAASPFKQVSVGKAAADWTGLASQAEGLFVQFPAKPERLP